MLLLWSNRSLKNWRFLCIQSSRWQIPNSSPSSSYIYSASFFLSKPKQSEDVCELFQYAIFLFDSSQFSISQCCSCEYKRILKFSQDEVFYSTHSIQTIDLNVVRKKIHQDDVAACSCGTSVCRDKKWTRRRCRARWERFKTAGRWKKSEKFQISIMLQ